MRKKPYFYNFLTVTLLVGFLAMIAFFNAWTFAPHAVENKAAGGQKAFAAYAVSNGWHVGVVVPAGRMNALLPELKKRFEKSAAINSTKNPTTMGDVNYYEIGWGDQGFYEAKEITTWMAVQAMFNSPGSVMHVVAVHNPAKAFAKSHVKKFCLSESQLANLETFIVNSFAKNTTDHIISRRPGLYGDSEFYKATGTYHFLNSCNTWAAKALRSAGFELSPTFKLFSRQVMNNIDTIDSSNVATC